MQHYDIHEAFKGPCVAFEVANARHSVGVGSKRDTPRHILRHRIKQLELFGVVPTDAERAEILREAELQIAREQLARAQERLRKAELAVELAAVRKDQARPSLYVVGGGK